MTHYEIRFQYSEGPASVVWDVDRADDSAAVRSAWDLLSNNPVEVWDGARRVAAVSSSSELAFMFEDVRTKILLK